MPTEWAMRKAAEFFVVVWPNDREYLLAFSTLIDAARAQGRREGLEEAARIAEKYADHADAVGDMRLDVCSGTIAIDIRAAINQEPTA